ncbi:hypothetical protein A3F34_02305 [Candidatus Roizmanbacteria bacterium RIFCSPHIGHO2_12_FULL_44_10]|uniref:Uncharacterized protein n=1 Tax=Candidatus Roizmanbacteria bacterium RIFCSPHIGHO2_12_FULL_44_10 TaxID=1802054 RepID=A0A1F7I937_9BACT|nr:MAG: hypothetical protein A3F34_02305 [Candidatus Roizmanbacteria bacterium RIFCSPHIGHO2_12_FULL_44_10]
MKTIDPVSVAVCLITQYPDWYAGEARGISNIDKVRGDLALDSIRASRKKGFVTFVGFHDNSPEFNKELKQIEGIFLHRRETEKSAPSKRQLIEAASSHPEIKVICMMEPEKVSFVKDCLELCATPILESNTDIVIPKRDDALFRQTYPDYMYQSEVESIKLYNEELKAHGIIPQSHDGYDMFFGPRVFANSPTIVDIFLATYKLKIENISFPDLYYDAEQLSNTLFFPVVLALKKGVCVDSVIVPFHYPPSQKENEIKGARAHFIEKRKAQRLGLIIELMHFATFLEKNQGSRVQEKT